MPNVYKQVDQFTIEISKWEDELQLILLRNYSPNDFLNNFPLFVDYIFSASERFCFLTQDGTNRILNILGSDGLLFGLFSILYPLSFELTYEFPLSKLPPNINFLIKSRNISSLPSFFQKKITSKFTSTSHQRFTNAISQDRVLGVYLNLVEYYFFAFFYYLTSLVSHLKQSVEFSEDVCMALLVQYLQFFFPDTSPDLERANNQTTAVLCTTELRDAFLFAVVEYFLARQKLQSLPPTPVGQLFALILITRKLNNYFKNRLNERGKLGELNNISQEEIQNLVYNQNKEDKQEKISLTIGRRTCSLLGFPSHKKNFCAFCSFYNELFKYINFFLREAVDPQTFRYLYSLYISFVMPWRTKFLSDNGVVKEDTFIYLKEDSLFLMDWNIELAENIFRATFTVDFLPGYSYLLQKFLVKIIVLLRDYNFSSLGFAMLADIILLFKEKSYYILLEKVESQLFQENGLIKPEFFQNYRSRFGLSQDFSPFYTGSRAPDVIEEIIETLQLFCESERVNHIFSSSLKSRSRDFCHLSEEVFNEENDHVRLWKVTTDAWHFVYSLKTFTYLKKFIDGWNARISLARRKKVITEVVEFLVSLFKKCNESQTYQSTAYEPPTQKCKLINSSRIIKQQELLNNKNNEPFVRTINASKKFVMKSQRKYYYIKKTYENTFLVRLLYSFSKYFDKKVLKKFGSESSNNIKSFSFFRIFAINYVWTLLFLLFIGLFFISVKFEVLHASTLIFGHLTNILLIIMLLIGMLCLSFIFSYIK